MQCNQKPNSLTANDTDMTTTVKMAVMSHLSDAQQIISVDADLANRHINFAKALILKYKNLNQEVTYRELDDLWYSETTNR